jgi:hypothetical protein
MDLGALERNASLGQDSTRTATSAIAAAWWR